MKFPLIKTLSVFPSLIVIGAERRIFFIPRLRLCVHESSWELTTRGEVTPHFPLNIDVLLCLTSKRLSLPSSPSPSTPSALRTIDAVDVTNQRPGAWRIAASAASRRRRTRQTDGRTDADNVVIHFLRTCFELTANRVS